MVTPRSEHLRALSHLIFTPALEAGNLKLSPFPENYNRGSKHMCDIYNVPGYAHQFAYTHPVSFHHPSVREVL